VNHARTELQSGAVLGQATGGEWLTIDPDRDHSGELYHVGGTGRTDLQERVVWLYSRVLDTDACMRRPPDQVAARPKRLPGGSSRSRHHCDVDQHRTSTDARQCRAGASEARADSKLVDLGESLVRVQLSPCYPQALDGEAIGEGSDRVVSIESAHRESSTVGSNEVEWGKD
jgi:hypothetical protein